MASAIPTLLRPAEVADVPALAALHATAWHETYRDILGDGAVDARSVARRARMWRRALGAPSGRSATCVYLATRDEQLVGFGCGGRQRTPELAAVGFDAEIYALYLLQAAQRRGVGFALMRRMAGRLKRSGHRGMSLWVLRENRGACAFYEGLGGIPLGTRDIRWASRRLAERAYGWTELGALCR